MRRSDFDFKEVMMNSLLSDSTYFWLTFLFRSILMLKRGPLCFKIAKTLTTSIFNEKNLNRRH
jgi:hypothetical protein